MKNILFAVLFLPLVASATKMDTLQLTATTAFASLPASANGTELYCSNCTNGSNPCVGGGTGAFALRENSAWDCGVNLPSTITAGGPTGSAGVIPIITWNAAGQLTVVTSAAVSIPFSSVTGSATCAQLPALTGGVTTSAGSCGTTVVTNANLTGPVTSTGNATAVTAGAITNTMLANAGAYTVKGNATSAGAAPTDLSIGILLGIPAFTDTGTGLQQTASVAGYFQHILQNTSANAAASADYVVNNDQGTASTHYGDFGVNSSTFSGTGSLALPGAIYVYAQTGDLVLATNTSNTVRLLANNAATDALDILTSNLPATPGLTGYLFGNGASAWTAATTIPFASLSGSVSCAQMPALTGDIVTTAGTCATAITAGNVDLTDLAPQNANTFVANATGGSAAPTAITQTQATAMINVATASLSGAIPAAQEAFLTAYKDKTVVLATSNQYASIACDGSTDDSANWNTLLTNVPNNSLIMIPGCTSMLTSGTNPSIPSGKHLTFKGAGQSKTVFQSNNNASDFFTVGDWYNTFDGMTFQGLNTTVTSAIALSATPTASLLVGATANAPASGSFYVQTNLGWTLAAYTSIVDGTHIGGVTAATSTTVAGGPITFKTGGYAINGGGNAHLLVHDVQFNYVYNGVLNNATLAFILDSTGFGVVNYDLQFNGANVNAVVHDYSSDGLPPAIAHIEVQQAGSLLVSDCDLIRAQSDMRLNPTSPNGVFGVFVVNTYFDTATGVSGTANSGNGILVQGTGNVQRVKIVNSWLSSATHDGFWSNSTAATLPTDIQFIGNNIYSNGANGIDWAAGQDFIASSNQISGNMAAGITITAGASSVTKALLNSNRIGPAGGIGANGTGIITATGTYGSMKIQSNDLTGNTTALTLNTVTVATWSNFWVSDNAGWNPHGAIATPTFPTTTTVVTNTTGHRVGVLFKSGATAPTVTTMNGVSTVLPLINQIVTYPLDPGGTIAFTFTVAGTWTWVGN